MQVLREDMGGDIRRMLDELNQNGVNSVHCGQEFSEPNEDYPVAGYEHSSGVKDGRGEKYWMAAVCPECGYQLTLKHQSFFTQLNTDISRFFNE